MKVNNVNTSFSGNLYLKNPQVWTERMRKAIADNQSIQDKLLNNDIVGYISKTTESRKMLYGHHKTGDSIYKVKFYVQGEPATFLDKVKNVFNIGAKRIDINKHYHSEYTTVRRLENLNLK